MKQYIQKDGYELKVSIGYEKGGMNYLSGRESRRGYYIYVQPVKTEKFDNNVVIESFHLFHGGKKLLFEVNRQSEKACKKACDMLELQEVQEFIQRMDEKTARTEIY